MPLQTESRVSLEIQENFFDIKHPKVTDDLGKAILHFGEIRENVFFEQLISKTHAQICTEISNQIQNALDLK